MKKVWKTILSVLLMFTIIFGQLFPWITAYAEGSDTTNLISNGDFSSSSGTVTVPNVILEADCEDFAEDALWVTYDGSGTTSVVTDPNDETNRVAAFTSTDNSNTGIAYKPDKGFF